MTDRAVAACGRLETEIGPRLQRIAGAAAFIAQNRNIGITEIIDENLLGAGIDACVLHAIML